MTHFRPTLPEDSSSDTIRAAAFLDLKAKPWPITGKRRNYTSPSLPVYAISASLIKCRETLGVSAGTFPADKRVPQAASRRRRQPPHRYQWADALPASASLVKNCATFQIGEVLR